MSKFKIGDTVRRLKTPGNSSTPVGYVGTIRRIEIDCDGETELYFDGGAWGYDNETSSAWEIVSTPNGPVRTVTRKEIYPGVYGRVEVMCGPDSRTPNAVQVAIAGGNPVAPHFWLNAEELRAAAAIFIELASALPLHEGSGE